MKRVHELAVHGCTLAFSITGKEDKPVLLLIPGANGTADIFEPVASHLSNQFNVCIYDRRGYGQSTLSNNEDDNVSLAHDADDAAALLTRVGDGKPAFVMGTSSGGIVAYELLRRYSNLIKKLVIHETLLPTLLQQPARDQVIAMRYGLYEKYRADGPAAGVNAFLVHLSEGEDKQVMSRVLNVEAGPNIKENVIFWFEHECRQHADIEFDAAVLQGLSNKLIVAIGMENDGPMQQAWETLATEVEAKYVRTPGSHMGYVTGPQNFAAALGSLASMSC